MIKQVEASEAKERFDLLLEAVRRQGEQYAIQEGNKTVAVLLPPEDFQAITQQQHFKEQAWRELETLVQNVHARHAHIPPEHVAQDVEEAIREVRQQRKR